MASQPLIHSGFAEFWYDSGLQTDVLALIDSIIDDGAKDQPWQVWCYGHSLGGAAAKLAALDIHHHLESQRTMDPSVFSVSCMTYGCPYVGNSSFVRDFENTIHRAWDLFHPNDAVSITGKWYIMYARCSQVCLISRFGDMVLNPSGLERLTLHPFGIKSVEEHLLGTYAKSLAAIIEKWALIEGQSTEKHVDSWQNLLDSNPAMLDLVALLESIAFPEVSDRSGGGGRDSKGSKGSKDSKDRSGRPSSSGEQMVMPLLRFWSDLDLEVFKLPKSKK
jgi:hypothetical protein